MQYAQIAEMIGSIGLPYAYYQFPEGTAQAAPFICFLYPESNDFLADNSNYYKIEKLNIELYQDSFDPAVEGKVEEVLAAAGLVYSKDRTVIDSEQLYETIYQMEVPING